MQPDRRPTTSIILSLLSNLILLTGAAGLRPAAARADEPGPAQALWERAEKLASEDEPLLATDEYRKLLFADTPFAGKARRRIKELNEDVCLDLVEYSRSIWKRDQALAVRVLTYAHELDQRNKEVKAAFEEFGYEFYQGAFRSADEIELIRKDRNALAEQRRTELQLPESFRYFTGGPFRFFTDLPLQDTKVRLMAITVQTHFNEYVRFMKDLGVRFPGEGLDVVFCGDRDLYVQLTDSPSTLGVYMPSRSAGYYFLTGGGDDFNTLMHEMTHQLNDKVLEVGILPACLEEGIAEYFGAGTLSSGNRRVTLGNPNYQIIYVKDALHGRKDARYIDFGSFLRADSSGGKGFYPQSWGLVQLLLHGLPEGRLLLADALVTAKREWASNGSPLDFEAVLERHGCGPEKLERAYRAYFQ